MDINIECENEIREGNLFDFISQRGHEFSQYDLITIIRELDYAISTVVKERKQSVWNYVADSLAEQR